MRTWKNSRNTVQGQMSHESIFMRCPEYTIREEKTRIAVIGNGGRKKGS